MDDYKNELINLSKHISRFIKGIPNDNSTNKNISPKFYISGYTRNKNNDCIAIITNQSPHNVITLLKELYDDDDDIEKINDEIFVYKYKSFQNIYTIPIVINTYNTNQERQEFIDYYKNYKK